MAEQAMGGKEVIIDLDIEGIEQIRLVPSIIKNTSRRIPGIDEGKLSVPDNFNDPLPEDIQQVFESDL